MEPKKNNQPKLYQLTNFSQVPEWRALLFTLFVSIAFSLFWVLFSDWLVTRLTDDPTALQSWQKAKEWVYIVSILLLLILLLPKPILDSYNARIRLQQQRDLFANLALASPAGILVTNASGYITFANPQASALLSLPPDQIINRQHDQMPLTFLTHTGDPLPPAELPFNLVQTTLKPVYNLPMAFQQPDGKMTYLQVNAAPILDKGNTFNGMVAIFLDVTEQKNTARDLELSEQYYRALVENAPIGIYHTRLNGEILYANRTLLDMFGYTSLDEFKTETATRHYADPAQRDEIIRQVKAKGTVNNIEVEFRTQQGEILHGLLNASLIGDELSGMIIDITQIKEQELALKHSEARARAYIEAIPDLMFVIDRNGIFHEYHAPDNGMLYVTPEVFLGKPLNEVLSQNLAEMSLKFLKTALESGNIQQFQYSLPVQGKLRHFEARMVPYGKDRVLVLSRDITEVVHLEQARQSAIMEERQRIARELHDAVSQTLFSTSVMAQSLAKVWETNPDKVKKGLDDLVRLTRGALAEMRMLLIELRPTTFERINLPELLQQLADGFASRSSTVIHTELSQIEPLPLQVRIAFYRIAQEALNNVYKHSQATHLTLQLTQDNSTTVLRIEDNGTGFNMATTTPGHGLEIMRERAAEIAAELQIETNPAQGTSIKLVWEDPASRIQDE